MSLFRRLAPALTSGLALVLCACSTARLSGLDAPRYSGGPPRAPERTMLTPPVSRGAPVERVERAPSETRPTYAAPEAPGASRDVRVGRWAQSPRGLPQRPQSTSSRPAQARREPYYERRGTARWMGASWQGYVTTTQEKFDPAALTGAHATLPLPSYVYVTNRQNRRTVLIRINDRPQQHGTDQRTVVIVSRRVADLLDFSRVGSAEVDLQYAGPAGLVSSGRHETDFLHRQPWFRNLTAAAPAGLYAGRPQPPAVGGAARLADGAAGDTWRQRYQTPAYPRWDGTRR